MLVLAIAGAAVALHGVGGATSSSDAASDDPYAAFCAPVPREAVVPKEVAADHAITVQVPRETPTMPVLADETSRPRRIKRGEVVEFHIGSPREGAVAVHGLSEVVRLKGGEAVVRFKALYTGRFPLHFHGADQSHFEIAVLEVSG